MNIKYRKPRYLIVLIPFGLLLLFGLLSLLACHGECHASNHGGMLQYVHYKIYISWEVTNLSIVFGPLGTIFGLSMLLYRLVFIYESKFDNNGINIIKRKNSIFIDYTNISDIEYEKPSLINYLFAAYSALCPGILKVNMKKDEKKRKTYSIRVKYKDYKQLPKKYKNLLKHPV